MLVKVTNEIFHILSGKGWRSGKRGKRWRREKRGKRWRKRWRSERRRQRKGTRPFRISEKKKE